MNFLSLGKNPLARLDHPLFHTAVGSHPVKVRVLLLPLELLLLAEQFVGQKAINAITVCDVRMPAAAPLPHSRDGSNP